MILSGSSHLHFLGDQYSRHDFRFLPGLILGLLQFSLTLLGETISGDKLAFAKSLRMGYIGACMFVIGFIVQSVPSIRVLLGL